tara:strand:- start:302 stop:886 length:585 start_codon:yes stop_codon:yes gene_type:complete
MNLPKKFILFDTEFTAWEGSQERNWSLEWEHRELISVSALKVELKENNLSIIEKFNCLIIPSINYRLSDYIMNLTGIKQVDIEKDGISFKKFIEKFYKFSDNLNLYSYGNDYIEIEENLKLNKIECLKYYNWKERFFDIKIFFKQNSINTENYSSGTVYKHFNIKSEKEISVHDAEWDTYSLYLTIKHIYSNKK